MFKMIALFISSIMVVGCASNSDVKALQGRADLTDVRINTLSQEHRGIVEEHDQIQADHQALNSKISELEQKFDRAFKKTMTK